MWTPLACGLATAVLIMLIGYVVIGVLWYRRKNAQPQPVKTTEEALVPLNLLQDDRAPDSYETPYNDRR
jgi:hypothetical protein